MFLSEQRRLPRPFKVMEAFCKVEDVIMVLGIVIVLFVVGPFPVFVTLILYFFDPTADHLSRERERTVGNARWYE